MPLNAFANHFNFELQMVHKLNIKYAVEGLGQLNSLEEMVTANEYKVILSDLLTLVGRGVF